MSALPDDSAILHDLQRGLEELDEYGPLYDKRRCFYEGKIAESIAHPTLSKMLGEYGAAFGLNYASVPVDALMDRVDLASLIVAKDETLTKRLLEDFWDANELDDDADDYHTKASYYGDFYAIVWPKPDGEEPAGAVEIFGKSPMTTRILYDRENSREAEYAITRWHPAKRVTRASLYYDDAVVEFIAKGERPKAVDFERYDPEGDSDGLTLHDLGFPVFHFRPDAKPYGRPVNERAYGPQAAITKINATHMAAMDYMGFPQRYALLDPLAESDDDIADDFMDEDVTSPPASPTDPSRVTGDKTATLKASPGSAWLLAGVKAVGQFEPAQATPFLESAQFQIRAAATLTRTPLYEFDLDGSGDAPSGEARRRADGPITKHAEKIKGTYGATWAQIGAFVLGSWGIGEGKTVEPNWMPSELATDKDGLELVGLKITNGVPPRAALMEAGYTVEQVDEWMPENAVPITPALLAVLAGAIRDLGQAKTLGLVSLEDVRLMLPDILVGTVPEPEPVPTALQPGQVPGQEPAPAEDEAPAPAE